jgi:AraC family transcriptional activator FtrA
MRQRLSEKQPIDMLAVEASMSTRTFLRRFKAATGLPPGEWLLGERLIHARELLETTRNLIEDIAGATGFGSAATLRHHFRSRLGTTVRLPIEAASHKRLRSAPPSARLWNEKSRPEAADFNV